MATQRAGAAEGAAGRRPRPSYDYLLVVGPGRSGSTWLHRVLGAHPAFAAAAVKEARHYRSPRRFERARRRLARRDGGAILLDASNLAWRDRRLANVARLRRRGHRVLLVVLLRRHRDRAASVVAFRRSRVWPALFRGAAGLERAAVRDSLTPAALERIHGLGCDVLTIGFEALTRRPERVFAVLARLCGTPPFGGPFPPPANRSVRARSAPLAAAGKLAAVLLRGAGAGRALQCLKDDPRVTGLFFRPAGAAGRVPLSPGARAVLDRRHRACLETVAAAGARLAEGVWFSAAPGAAASRRA